MYKWIILAHNHTVIKPALEVKQHFNIYHRLYFCEPIAQQSCQAMQVKTSACMKTSFHCGKSVILHWVSKFKVHRRVQIDCFSSTFAGVFSTLDHLQKGLSLLEDCNHLNWPPVWQMDNTTVTSDLNDIPSVLVVSCETCSVCAYAAIETQSALFPVGQI